ncbi:MAG: HlyD family efflux transporter periplasmic adaptor subunit [Planctomycetota bacterium]
MNRFKKYLPSRKWLFIPPILIGLAVLVAFAIAKRPLPKSDNGETAKHLNVLEVHPKTVTPYVIAYGSATADKVWTAIAEVRGRITEIHPGLESGNPINAGELLFRIEDVDYQLALTQRQADLAAAEARVRELNASQSADQKSLQIEKDLLKLAREDRDRIRKLRQNRAVSQSELDSSESNLLIQEQAIQRLENSISLYPSKLASAQASVAIANSAVEVAGRDIKRTEVRSPIDGIVIGAKLEVDQIVSAGQTLFDIRSDDFVEVEAQVTLSQLRRLLPELGSNPSELSEEIFDARDVISSLKTTVEAHSGDFVQRWEAEPIRISESINQQTRTLGIVVQVRNPNATSRTGSADRRRQNSLPTKMDAPALAADQERALITNEPPKPTYSKLSLRPGTYCEVRLSGQPIKDAIVLPRTAFDGEFIYTVDSNSRLKKVQVIPGSAIGEQVVVDQGVFPKQLVAVRPPMPAIEGALIAIKIVNPEASDSRTDGDTAIQWETPESPLNTLRSTNSKTSMQPLVNKTGSTPDSKHGNGEQK